MLILSIYVIQTNIKMNNKLETIKKIYNSILEEAIAQTWYGNCVAVSILFKEALTSKNIDSEIKVGYLLFNSRYTKTAIWHCWVEISYETSTKIYDIATDIMYKLVENFPYKRDEVTVSFDLPVGYSKTGFNRDHNKIALANNMKMINFYKNNPSEFWKNNFSLKSKDEDDISFNEFIIFKNTIFSKINE
mgnify:CR=1 FL=1|jgi:hypothetical protein